MVINKKNGFLVKKASVKVFAKNVLQLLNRPTVYNKYSTNSLKVASNFTEEIQAKKLLKIYKEVIRKEVIKKEAINTGIINNNPLFYSNSRDV